MKTIFALVLPLSLALLLGCPRFTSGEFSLGWFVVDFSCRGDNLPDAGLSWHVQSSSSSAQIFF